MTTIHDLYIAQGLSEREMEVRDELSKHYEVPFGQVSKETYAVIRELDAELKVFIAARKAARTF